jgi:hypothetical protein
MSKDKKFEFGVKDGKLSLAVDSNKDGENLIKCEVDLNEGFAEAFKKGEKLEGQKKVDFDLSASGLKLKVDSDQDGEPLFTFELSFAEVVDELKDQFFGGSDDEEEDVSE